MGLAIEGCGNAFVGTGGTLTVDELRAAADPTAKRLDGLVNDFAERLDKVDKLRGRSGFAKAAAAVEADIDKRLGGDRAKIVADIKLVRLDAEHDQADLTLGPARDTDAYVGSNPDTGLGSWFGETYCMNANYDKSLGDRINELNESTTLYRRMSHAYERLNPSLRHEDFLSPGRISKDTDYKPANDCNNDTYTVNGTR